MVDVALLTGGGDRPYALGLTQSLTARGLTIDFIGSDFLDCEELRRDSRVKFLNLRGDMSPSAPTVTKAARVLRYYVRLLRYTWGSRAPIFHILWNNKFESLDRTILMLLYRGLGKKLVLTVHNVNAGQRDGTDSWWNRLTLRIQYQLAHHLFVHTKLMKRELIEAFSVDGHKVSAIPFGVNETVPVTALTSSGARAILGLPPHGAVLLFFGNIAPYKGVEYLVEALPEVLRIAPETRLIIAGRPKGAEAYWNRVERRLVELGLADRVLRKIEYVPDAETEVYFKAADALVLPYTEVFQSGVLLLGYGFGLPAIAAQVGSLEEDVRLGETGFLTKPASPEGLSSAIAQFLSSDLYAHRHERRLAIQQYAKENYSWATVAGTTTDRYRELLSDSHRKA